MSCTDILEKYLKSENTMIPEDGAKEICNCFHIPLPRSVIVKNKQECLEQAKNIGFPLVMKIQSRQIIHKSDLGGVVVGIRNLDELSAYYDSMIQSISKKMPKAIIEGVMLQHMVSGGIETIIGGIQDPLFGPTVMFGLGGIYVEAFKDVAFRLAPLSHEEALRQIHETKIYKILQGIRGKGPCDIEGLSNLVVNTGKILTTFPQIKEIDFNPVICKENECVVVDARFILKK